MNIEYSLVRDLRPYPHNARTHSNKQIRQIAGSIKKFGFCNPVLIDDQKQIIAGRGRVEAAKSLGIDAVPTVRLSHLSEAEKRTYILADNRLAERAGWDREILAIELQALIDLDVEVELAGFEVPEIDLILDEARDSKGAPTGPEDTVPQYVSSFAVSQIGDKWTAGQHCLNCDDARDATAYDRLLEGTRCEQALTDPPYNVAIDGNVCGHGSIQHREFAMASGEMSEAEFIAFLETVFANLAAHTVDGSIRHIFMDWRHQFETLSAGRKVYTELKNLCVWNKTAAGLGSFYRSKHELVFVFKNGTAAHINNFELNKDGRNRTNVWDYPGVNTTRPGRMEDLAMHPTVKPTALIAEALKDCSRRSGLVLDPFCGSGTILIAAEKTGRRARALEIDPHFVDVAIRRWQLYTGKSAVLAATGETFELVEERRGAERAAA